MLLDGEAILERDAQGQPIIGDTLLLLLNASAADVAFALPGSASAWQCVIDTAAAGRRPTRPGHAWPLTSRSAAVFKQIPGVPRREADKASAIE